MQYRASCKDPEPQDGINLAESQNTAYCLESFHATQARRTAPFTTLRALPLEHSPVAPIR
jgi:hypothetical protein